MNCEKGDVAIVTKANLPSNLGKVVTCIRLATASEVSSAGLRTEEPVWVVDALMEWGRIRKDTGESLGSRGHHYLATDHCLKPLPKLPPEEVQELLKVPTPEEV